MRTGMAGNTIRVGVPNSVLAIALAAVIGWKQKGHKLRNVSLTSRFYHPQYAFSAQSQNIFWRRSAVHFNGDLALPDGVSSRKLAPPP